MKNKLIALIAIVAVSLVALTSCGDDGYELGFDIPVVDENGFTGEIFNPADHIGTVMVINFWGVWCSYCLDEMPTLDSIASDFGDKVKVIAIHTDYMFEDAPEYIDDNFKDSKIIFGKDEPTPAEDAYYTVMGGTGSYPYTVIIEVNGNVSEIITGATTYLSLMIAVNNALNPS